MLVSRSISPVIEFFVILKSKFQKIIPPIHFSSFGLVNKKERKSYGFNFRKKGVFAVNSNVI